MNSQSYRKRFAVALLVACAIHALVLLLPGIDLTTPQSLESPPLTVRFAPPEPRLSPEPDSPVDASVEETEDASAEPQPESPPSRDLIETEVARAAPQAVEGPAEQAPSEPAAPASKPPTVAAQESGNPRVQLEVRNLEVDPFTALQAIEDADQLRDLARRSLDATAPEQRAIADLSAADRAWFADMRVPASLPGFGPQMTLAWYSTGWAGSFERGVDKITLEWDFTLGDGTRVKCAFLLVVFACGWD